MLYPFLGKYDKTPNFKVSHWPSIPTGVLVKFGVTFTPGKSVSIEHGDVIIFSCPVLFFYQKRYYENWEGGEAYEIPRLPDGG